MENPMKKCLHCIATAVILLACTGGVALAAPPAEQTFTLKIQHGQLAPDMRVIRVKQGDLVRLEWSTDEAVTLHLHGYEIEKEVKPGAITVFTFKAYATGRFPIHLHAGPDETHGETILGYFEVYPR